MAIDVSAEIKLVNMAAVVSAAGVVLKNSGGGRQVGLCPFHSEKGASFTVYEENTFYCFGCGAGGDAAEFVMKFYNIDFPEALRRLGIETDGKKPTRAPSRRPKVDKQKPAASVPFAAVFDRPSDTWLERAQKFTDWCHRQLLKSDIQLTWLQERGINKETVTKRRLGWNPGESDEKPCFYRHRKTWGLPDEIKKNGKKKMLWLPRGLVIPLIDGDTVARLRIRAERPRYYVVPGSNMNLMVFNGDHRCLVVVESELDAILLNAVAGDLAGFVAIGSSAAKPDSQSEFYLNKTSYIIVALDYDAAGAKALEWWRDHYPRAKVWPLPNGKDPGEAFQAGCDLREWILAAYPPGWHLQRSVVGHRPAPKLKPDVKIEPPQDVPESVVELAGLIKRAPVRIIVTSDQLKLVSPPAWNHKNWDTFGRISQLVYFTPEIERVSPNRIKITESGGAIIQSQTVAANLLFAILEKLEEIRCGIIDVEEAQKQFRTITMKDPT